MDTQCFNEYEYVRTYPVIAPDRNLKIGFLLFRFNAIRWTYPVVAPIDRDFFSRYFYIKTRFWKNADLPLVIAPGPPITLPVSEYSMLNLIRSAPPSHKPPRRYAGARPPRHPERETFPVLGPVFIARHVLLPLPASVAIQFPHGVPRGPRGFRPFRPRNFSSR